MPSEMIGVQEAASELRVGASRVRELLAQGALPGEKVSGRWLLRRADVLARRSEQVPPGRPLSVANAWLLLLDASGERAPAPVDAVARWRMHRALVYPGLTAMRGRLQRRAQTRHFWALAAELRALRDARDVVLTGSSAAGELGLELVAPDALDAYVPAQRVRALAAEHALQEVDAAQANVTLRAVPQEAWLFDGRELAPAAAVALDLSAYPDSRSARVGETLLKQLDREGRRR